MHSRFSATWGTDAGSLRIRRIINHNIGDVGAFAVAGFIECSKKLIMVDIQRNGITPEGVTRLAEAVSINSSLLSLEYVT